MRDQQHCCQRRWPAEVCTFSARSRLELCQQMDRIAAQIGANSGLELRDLAYSLNTGVPVFPEHRIAIVASNPLETAGLLGEASRRLAQSDCARIRDRRGIYFFEAPPALSGQVAFVFPGEGSQYRGMLADLCMHFPHVRLCFDELDRAFLDQAAKRLPSESLFPVSGETPAPDSGFYVMDGATEAVFAASQALLSVLERLDVRPDVVVGHCAGDFSALAAAGALRSDRSEMIRYSRELSSVNAEAPEGVMLAVSSEDSALVAQVLTLAEGRLHLAMDNCPHQLIICGDSESVDQAAATLNRGGAVCAVLPLRFAYHTPLFQSLSARLLQLWQRLDLTAPRIPVYSCVTAQPYPSEPDEIRKLTVAQWSRTVRFGPTVRAMWEAGVRVFVEVGPKGNLTAFADDALRDCDSVRIALDLPAAPGLLRLQHAVGELFAAGVPMRLESLYEHRNAERLPLGGPGGPRASTPGGLRTLELRLPVLHGSEDSPLALPPETRAAVHARPPATPPDPLGGYFANMRRFLQVEREVLLAAVAARPLARSMPGWPFMRTVVSILPGRSATVLCDIDLDEDLFLRDHTLASPISATDESLVGLPVLPMTFGMEILAEAASLVVPGKPVLAMKDVVASRWLALENGPLSIEITAERADASDEVRASLRERLTSGAAGSRGTPAVEATVVFGRRESPRHTDSRLALTDEQASRWVPGRMYSGACMFHGPMFQLVHSIDRTGTEGTEATLIGRPRAGCFRSRSADRFAIDPFWLDAMCQVGGYWVGDRFDTALSVFPVRLARVEFGGSTPQPGVQTKCLLRVRSATESWIVSDADLVGPDGTRLIRMTGFWGRRLDLPRRWYDFRFDPVNVLLSDPLPDSDAGGAADCSVSLGPLPEDLSRVHGAIWMRVFAYMVLTRAERTAWHALDSTDESQLDWLAERIAAKDAVRLLLGRATGRRLCPADIEVSSGEGGTLAVSGSWPLQAGLAPMVSVHRTGRIVVAKASAFDPQG